jgi:hypothetical protein
MRTSNRNGWAGAAARSRTVSDFVDEFAAVLSQEPDPDGQVAAQQRVGMRPVDQETHVRKPQSASVPASRARGVMLDVTPRPAANSSKIPDAAARAARRGGDSEPADYFRRTPSTSFVSLLRTVTSPAALTNASAPGG